MAFLHHADLRTALYAAAAACYLNPVHPPWRAGGRRGGAEEPLWRRTVSFGPLTSCRASSSRDPVSTPIATAQGINEIKKPPICTADELHYVPVPGTEWSIALWRYKPCPEAPKRNHPLMLLSGVGTNAIGYDLSPGASFARHMSSSGFDTWIVEVRGAGLSMRGAGFSQLDSDAAKEFPRKPTLYDVDSVVKSKSTMPVEQKSLVKNGIPNSEISNRSVIKMDAVGSEEPLVVTKLTATFLRLAERLSGYLNEGQLRAISANFFDRISKLLEDAGLSERFNETSTNISGLLEARQTSAVASQLRDLSQRLVNIIEEGQRSVSPQLFDLQERLSATIEDFQKQLDLIVTYNWDFDNYLEEDVPAAMEYIKMHSKATDDKLLAIGHSMGGILLYAMQSKCEFEGRKSGLAATVTLASSLDYRSSNSSLKLLLPLVDPAQALNVPVVPLGALLAAAYPLASRPPYALSWLNSLISAQDMMHPELFEKFVLNNFCTIPAKVILQLTTAFREGGLRNRSGTFCYKDHLHACSVPVLAVAGDQDMICPPEAVYETVKLIPEQMVTYKVFGNPSGPHYGHYDLVGGRLAIDEVYVSIVDFLCLHDGVPPCEPSD